MATSHAEGAENASERVVLHVGCGTPGREKLDVDFRGPQWREVRLDIDPAVQPDIVGSITRMTAVATASVDAVWSSHNLEHLYAHEVALALAEFHRVLTPDGILKIRLPDLQRVAELVAQGRLEEVIYHSPAGPITPLDMLYGHRASVARGNEFMAHRTGFTARTLGEKLIRAGFARAQVRRAALDLWATAWKSMPIDSAATTSADAALAHR
jgi:SAM-dependent methyltransferase